MLYIILLDKFYIFVKKFILQKKFEIFDTTGI